MRRNRAWWTDTVVRWRGSGLTQADFARRERINVNTLRWWVARLRDDDGRAFVELVEAYPSPEVDTQRTPVVLELEVGTATLRFSGLPPAAWLADVLATC